MNSGFVNNGLAGLAALPVSKHYLQRHVLQMRKKRNGQPPTPYRLGGTMAWYKRTFPSSYPMNRYLASLGWDKNRVLDDLKQRVPKMFTISLSSSTAQQILQERPKEVVQRAKQAKAKKKSNKTSQTDSQQASTGNKQKTTSGNPTDDTPTTPSAKTSGFGWMKWGLLLGGAGTVLYLMFNED
jgi:hypothetical protein